MFILWMAAVGLVGCYAGFPNPHEAQALGLAAGSGGDCAACLAGDASFCRLISGIFTRSQLPPGYNLIAQIPRGACNINITEMKHSRNYLSLRHTGGGGTILNGNWARDWSGDYPAAGTIFTYHRHDPRGGPKAGESISAPGPTTTPVDLLLVSHVNDLILSSSLILLYYLRHCTPSSVNKIPHQGWPYLYGLRYIFIIVLLYYFFILICLNRLLLYTCTSGHTVFRIYNGKL
ncbi:hypothetical protein J437_LFUL010351, partial [Ladona fulva]